MSRPAMSEERTLKGDDTDEKMKTDQDTAFEIEEQRKRASETKPKATMLLDLPMELLEQILIDAIIREVSDRKIIRHAWKKSADSVAERLRIVCQQWENVLTARAFQSRLHGKIDTYPQVKLCFKVLARSRFSSCVTAAAMNDDVYVLCHQPQPQTYIEVYAINDPATLKRSIHLQDVRMPWDMVACSSSNCLYVLHQAPQDIAVLRVSKTGQQFQVSQFISCSNQLVVRMCVSEDGRLFLFQGPVPSTISVYNVDGTLLSKVELVKPISYLHSMIPKSNGNLVLAMKANLAEIDGEGKTVQEYKTQSHMDRYLYSTADEHDRIVMIDQDGSVRLLDAEFNCVMARFQLQAYQHGKIHMYRVSYSRKRNEFVAFETAAFCDRGDAIQCLSVFNFTEENVPDDPKDKQKCK